MRKLASGMVAQGDTLPLVELPNDQEHASNGLGPAKRAFYIGQITEALAISLVRDTQAFARVRTIPGATSSKRLIWERTREAMVNSLTKLFQLDREQLTQGRWNAGSGPVIDVPTNVKQVSDPQKPVA